MACFSGPNVVDDSLVLCLDAANTKSYVYGSNAWTDLSGNGNNGTFHNHNPNHTSGAGGYFTFDGSNDYAQLDNNNQVAPSTGSFSCFFWYQITGTGGRGGLFERTPASPYNGWSLGQGGTSNWACRVSDGTNYRNYQFSYPSTNTWYYDGFTWNGSGTLNPYRNGSIDTGGTATSSGTVGNIDNSGDRHAMAIASRRDASPAYLPCKISHIHFYNKALSAAEVAQNFNALRGRYGI
jgi:hypothetical protein